MSGSGPGAEEADERRSADEVAESDRGDHADRPAARSGSSAPVLMPTGKQECRKIELRVDLGETGGPGRPCEPQTGEDRVSGPRTRRHLPCCRRRRDGARGCGHDGSRPAGPSARSIASRVLSGVSGAVVSRACTPTYVIEDDDTIRVELRPGTQP
jgi:hypothetical protein